LVENDLPPPIPLLVQRCRPDRARRLDPDARRVLLRPVDEHRRLGIEPAEGEMVDLVAGDVADLALDAGDNALLAGRAGIAADLDMVVGEEAIPEAGVHLLPSGPASGFQVNQRLFGRR